MFDMNAIKAVAESWGSIDGKYDPRHRKWQTKSHEETYYEEAKELLKGLQRRGYRVVTSRSLLQAD